MLRERPRVALCADFVEEGWPSMDRVARELEAHVDGAVALTPVCPPFARVAGRIPPIAGTRLAVNADRGVNRWWTYPRRVAALAASFDVFHIVDHSYAQLVHGVPGARAVVTCHDLDTFRSVTDPEHEPRSALFRAMTARILSGLRKAARVTCDTSAIRDELVWRGLVAPERVVVVPIGVSAAFGAAPDPEADQEAARLVPPEIGFDVLHVGSTIRRKRIDTLLEAVAAAGASVPGLRLVRVGGAFTPEQRRLADELGVRTIVVDEVNDRTLAALYRRAALVLQPSEREGFGLPVLEALACGTPVVASDLPVFREVGAHTLTYCPVGDVGAWARAIQALAAQRQQRPTVWDARRLAGRLRARCFSWARFADRMVEIYQELAA